MLKYTISGFDGQTVGVLDIIDDRVIPAGWKVEPIKKPNGEIVEFQMVLDVEAEPVEPKVKPSNLAELIEFYFAARKQCQDAGEEWDPRKETVYVTDENYQTIINDEAFGHTDGPDVVPITKSGVRSKRFWGMKIKVD